MKYWMVLGLGFLPSLAARAADLPEGICPFRAEKIEAAFTPGLRHDYGEAGIREPFARRERWYGPCARAVPVSPGLYRLEYEQANVVIELEFTGRKIEQFSFGQMQVPDDSWEKFSAVLHREWPAAAFLARQDGGEAGLQSGKMLAVGEAKDLLIAAKMAEKLRAGKMGESQPIVLADSDKVQEIDELAGEKSGFPLRPADLFERMLSRLDRTAGDVALRALGRDSLEDGREEAKPFLFRREAGWLMSITPDQMAALSRDGAVAKAAELNHPNKIPPIPRERYDHLEKVQWWASAAELCTAAGSLLERPEFPGSHASRNFQQAHPSWKRVAYFAARDFGVAATTWTAQLPGLAKSTCFSLILNQPQFLDEDAVEELEIRAESLILGTVQGRPGIRR